MYIFRLLQYLTFVTIIAVGLAGSVLAYKNNYDDKTQKAIENYLSVLAITKASRPPIKNHSPQCKKAINAYIKAADDLDYSSDSLALCCAGYKNCSEVELYAHLLGSCASNKDFEEDCSLEYDVMTLIEAPDCPQCKVPLNQIQWSYDDFESAYDDVQSACH